MLKCVHYAVLTVLMAASCTHSFLLLPNLKARDLAVLAGRNDFEREDYDFGFDESSAFDDWKERRWRPQRQRQESQAEVVGGGMWSRLFPQRVTKALLAGVFVIGVGTGVTVDSAINTNPKDLASRDAIDRAVPNSELCQQYGASAMVMDQRLFVSFNPFNVYVTQADTKPGCVLRPSTVVPILADRGLLDKNEIASCKNNMNTWAFVGDLDERPQLSCVYRSQDAQNEFLSNPTIGLGEDIYDNGIPGVRRSGGKQIETAKRVKGDN